MEQTIQRLAKVLGASAIESFGPDSRFAVEGEQGGRLQVSVRGAQQRMMAVLKDAQGIVRCTLDLAPIRSVTEDPAFPHRVVVHIGHVDVQIDAEPTLAVEVITSLGT